MAKPIKSFPNLQLGYFSLYSFASKLGFAVVKGKISSAYGVTVYKEPGRRKGVVNTARDDDASGLTALLRIEHLAGGFWQFSFRRRQGTSSSAVRWENLSLELERKLEKKGSLEFCCRGSRCKGLELQGFFLFFLSGLD
jgi:hypothetical protein